EERGPEQLRDAERRYLRPGQQVVTVRGFGETPDRPAALIDTNGPRPFIAIAGGLEHIEELSDLAAEGRYYGEDAPRPREVPDINAAHQDWLEWSDRQRKGIKTHGPLPHYR